MTDEPKNPGAARYPIPEYGTPTSSVVSPKVTVLASLGVVLIASLSLIGWISGLTLLASIRKSYVPMAPSTAICLLLLASVLLMQVRATSCRIAGSTMRALIVLVLAFGVCEALDFFGIDVNLEDRIFPQSGTLDGIPLGQMSPLTSGLFLLSALSMLLSTGIWGPVQREHKSAHFSGVLAFVTAFGGFTTLLGYLYGTPLLYSSPLVPVAATTAAAFLVLGIAITCSLPAGSIPLVFFLGNSTPARLVRRFVPLVVVVVIVQAFIHRIAPVLWDINDALLSASVAAIVAALSGAIAFFWGAQVGNRIDQAALELRMSEERFRLATEAAEGGVWDWYVQTGHVIYNQRWADMLGISMDENTQHIDLWKSMVHPDDLPGVWENITRHLQGLTPHYDVEYRLRDSSRKWKWIHARGIVVDRDEAERALRIAGIALDITDRKEAEDLLFQASQDWEDTFDSMTDSITIHDRNFNVIRYNRSAAEFLGLGGELTTPESKCYAYYHGTGCPPAGCPSCDCLETGRQTIVETFEPHLNKFIELRAIPRFDSNGHVKGLIHIVRDISDRKRADEEKAKLEQQLLQSQKMEAVGTLAGGIAHDFNNVLQVTLGYSELILGDEELAERYKADIRKIYESATRGADLVQRLLTFSRKTEVNPLPLNLNRRINEVRKMLERIVPKMIEIQLVLAEDLAAINADGTQMDQILMNLAVNARDAMHERGRLLFETANVFLDEEYAASHLNAKPGHYVLLNVTDTGVGMDQETLEHIFEPFYTTKETGKGTGLGLAMVYGIVQEHGGHIRCYSEPGEGTTFKIYFPALVSEEEVEISSGRAMPRGGSETLLLVDDEQMIRDLGARILTQAGYHVIAASNGKEALELYRAQRDKISLVILDLIMPEMGGKQCLDALLRLNPTVKVIIASGYSADGPTKDALNAGAKGFVNKPYDMRQMLNVVRRVLDAEQAVA